MRDLSAYQLTDWLPTTPKEARLLGWEQPDVILFSGDAYVDHPSFGAAVIGRLLQNMGLKVAIVPQPNWRDDLRDFKKFCVPRLFFGVSAGAMDSMVNHYTANRRLRSDDAYTPGGKAGFRPDYATTVYTQILKKLFPDVPVLIGGIEASLRRLTHYDYWKDELMPGILASSGADMLVYGMGEQPLKEIVQLLEKGVPFSSLTTVAQTAITQPLHDELPKNKHWSDLELASHEACLADKKVYASNFRHIEEQSNRWHAARLIQNVGDKRIVINPPFPPMTSNELDASFDLPYTRLPHPRYKDKGAIPAFEMIKFSVNIHRGCFGGCSFCTISAHQGKFIASRSKESVLREVEQVMQMPDFKGYLSDLGGPSANMYQMQGIDLKLCERCTRPSCIHPNICKNLNTDHTPLIDIYRSVDKLPGIKKSFIGSGVRYDMLLNPMAGEAEKTSHQRYMKELIAYHVSGRLKVAPEHTSDQVLKMMRKPSFSLFKKFSKIFDDINREQGLKQQLVPYFISSHPGSREEDMAQLATEAHELNFQLEQVQDFTPTPMTVSTEIYYSGYHPYTLEPVFTAHSKDEKLQQRMYFFWYKPEYRQKIESRLRALKRSDLIQKLFQKSGKAEQNLIRTKPSAKNERTPFLKNKRR
ncbi:putative radical SAM protein YgiQ [Breznakibacter xylanolyticus]|uniref:Putative radical SAM protein YgiQ n=1 Tax=Breznakibacter xylanolyticus TaxID=990 RepID=A0A2W7QEE3_9BACT|nr:YgiQ family radical SAM protein [Breznakibacter xylanolyticus]PZX20279.1 putative radical SAM protein YgiQ [Breznakibacter xylanolyticus]